MKTISFLVALSLTLSPALYGVSGGGGGHGSGGHGGAGAGGHTGGQRSGSHQAPSRQNGHWQNHSGEHNGRGNWNNRNWNGRSYNTWHGPYYYGGAGWYAGGLFLVGFTFYTCTLLAIASTHTWSINNDDVNTYNSWPDQQNVSIMQVEDDSEWPYRLCYNNGSCVRARPAPGT